MFGIERVLAETWLLRLLLCGRVAMLLRWLVLAKAFGCIGALRSDLQENAFDSSFAALQNL